MKKFTGSKHGPDMLPGAGERRRQTDCCQRVSCSRNDAKAAARSRYPGGIELILVCRDLPVIYFVSRRVRDIDLVAFGLLLLAVQT